MCTPANRVVISVDDDCRYGDAMRHTHRIAIREVPSKAIGNRTSVGSARRQRGIYDTRRRGRSGRSDPVAVGEWRRRRHEFVHILRRRHTIAQVWLGGAERSAVGTVEPVLLEHAEVEATVVQPTDSLHAHANVITANRWRTRGHSFVGGKAWPQGPVVSRSEREAVNRSTDS